MSPTEKSPVSPPSRILLIGNGVNRVVSKNQQYSWDAALKKLERLYLNHALSTEEDMLGDDTSYCLRLQRVLNCIEKEKRSVVFGAWLTDLASIQPNYVHHLLATLVEQDIISTVMTTNYDFAFEKALSSSVDELMSAEQQYKFTVQTSKSRKVVDVYHIHGAAIPRTISGDDRVVMSIKSYAEHASKLNWQYGSGWLDLFCKKEVHICGFAFYSEELLMWEALKQRLNYIRAHEPFEELNNRLFVYLFYTAENKAQQEQLAKLLTSYAAEPVLIPVADDDYPNAWMSLYGYIALRHNHLRLTEGSVSLLSVNKYPQHDTRNKNIRVAFCPSLYYPHCCKFELPLDKDTPVWCFYCEVHRKVTRWVALSAEIKKGLLSLGAVRKNKHYTCFYLDYTNGDLFAVKSADKELQPVCRLAYISDSKDFNQFINPFSN